ncbi:ATP-binding cassette domain-containing protein [Nonomuraea sp. NPDC046802]|uniref:polyamine ABC transporter ATP-binding protein n=1 Tax=Nonomuraea sp. NPDC046802 TaxID=3154919 RepID=UPI0033FA17ED
MAAAVESDLRLIELPGEGAGHVEIEGLAAGYEGARVLDLERLSIRKGEFLSILGPSGCGKTTLLNSIAGFVRPTAGRIVIDGSDVTDRPPYRRGLGMVFQNYALFPHMTVAANVAYGLRVRRLDRAEREERVREALRLVGLEGYAERRPKQLSGGQQQRVALARALAIRPAVLLLDEPLSNLDAKLRREMRMELRAIQRRIGTTMIFVTHDQEEALALSDRVAVMNGGRIEQLGTPDEVYRRPATRFVAQFIGAANVLEGTVTASGGLDVGGITVGCGPLPVGVGERAVVAIRPERIRLRTARTADATRSTTAPDTTNGPRPGTTDAPRSTTAPDAADTPAPARSTAAPDTTDTPTPARSTAAPDTTETPHPTAVPSTAETPTPTLHTTDPAEASPNTATVEPTDVNAGVEPTGRVAGAEPTSVNPGAEPTGGVAGTVGYRAFAGDAWHIEVRLADGRALSVQSADTGAGSADPPGAGTPVVATWDPADVIILNAGPEPGPDTQPGTGPEARSGTKPGTGPKAESGTEQEAGFGAGSEAESGAKPGAGPETGSDAKPGAGAG